MMQRAAILSLIASCSLLAQENSPSPHHPLIYNDASTGNWTPPREQRTWTMTFSNALGYRRDRQKLNTSADQSVSYFHNFNTLYNKASLVFAWDRVLLKLSGDYGWLINGDLNFKALGGAFLEPAENFPTIKMGSGYCADVDAAIGCRIKFWKFCKGSLSFIPALGYIYSHFNAYPQQEERSPVPAIPINLPLGTTGYSSITHTRPNQQDWFGPYAEGRIAFSWKEQWRLDFYYQYIPIDFRQTVDLSIGNFFYNPAGTLSQADRVRMHLGSKSDTTRTQLGGVDLSYGSCANWRLGAHFDASSTWTHTAHSIVHDKTTTFLPSSSTTQSSSRERLDIQWVRYSTNLYCSYWY
jgi:hypothetical protein